MKNHFKAVLDYCKSAGVKMNFSPNGVELWSSQQIDLALKNPDVKVKDIEKTVEAFVAVKETGWTNS